MEWGHCAPLPLLRGTLFPAAVALVQPASRIGTSKFGCFQIYTDVKKNLDWGHCDPYTPRGGAFLNGARVLVNTNPRANFQLRSSITFKDTDGVSKWGSRTPIRGHRRGREWCR